MPQLVSFLFNTTIPGFLDLSITLDHNIPQNVYLFIFCNTSWSMFIPFFTSFQIVFPRQFPTNYFCNIIAPSLVLLLCQLFTFAHNMRYCYTFVVTHSTNLWFGCSICLLFHIVFSNWLFLRSTQHGFRFNFQVSYFQPVPCFFFICFFGISLTNCPFFCFSIVPSFFSSNYIWIFSYSLYHYILFCSFEAFNQWLNWISNIPFQFIFFHSYKSLTTYQPPSSHSPAKIYPTNITFGMKRSMHCLNFSGPFA